MELWNLVQHESILCQKLLVRKLTWTCRWEVLYCRSKNTTTLSAALKHFFSEDLYVHTVTESKKPENMQNVTWIVYALPHEEELTLLQQCYTRPAIQSTMDLVAGYPTMSSKLTAALTGTFQRNMLKQFLQGNIQNDPLHTSPWRKWPTYAHIHTNFFFLSHNSDDDRAEGIIKCQEAWGWWSPSKEGWMVRKRQQKTTYTPSSSLIQHSQNTHAPKKEWAE